ncbi:glycyl-radical enzyme activating protein [Clostridium sp. MCC353]|uniref:glycyl-radical enzyme activating protein n=1 Tax=Clostridium sp. MCC353 TaxID=2592646 RepID=UPI001C030E10|nr:glycyl-radical enzyme activating protein [Clostridium sp. MCC353]
MNRFVPNPETGLIFNIQRFCLHDGPGIRTAVFFSGCPLTCPWCCNPESEKLRPVLLHDGKTCALCGLCARNCPSMAVSISGGFWKMDPGRCTACGRCAAACPHDALELSGRVYTLEEAANEVLKDQAFFEKSGGGVTLSGGEVLMQAEFAAKLAKRLKTSGVHTACETTAALSGAAFEQLMAEMDYIMIDIKHYDAEKLWQTCHGDLNIISGNIKAAVNYGIPLAGRIPVIPGFNSSMQDMEGFALFGRELGIREIHLLPFHQMGEEKYERLQKQYLMKDEPPLHKEDLMKYAGYLESRGFQVEIGG